MRDHDPLVKQLLDEHVPLRDDAKPDWMEVARKAAGASAGGSTGGAAAATQLKKSKARTSSGLAAVFAAPVGSRRLSALVAFTVVVLGVGVAFAAARGPLGKGTAGFPRVVTTTGAEKLVEFTLTSGYSIWSGGTTIALWRVPQDGGWECYQVALASPAPTPNGGENPLGGGICYLGTPQVLPGKPMRVDFGATQPSWSWLISGQVNPSSGIDQLELESARGRLPLSYANGWFLGQLPPSGSGEKLPGGGPYVLVGSDNHGHAVAHVDLADARSSIEHKGK